MVENKATALKNTDYTLKLILGREPGREPKIIDVSGPVKEALTVEETFSGDISSYGITKRIIGLWESCSSPNWLTTPPIYTHMADIFILQDINRIIDAAIVNAKQAESVKSLIADAFAKRDSDRMAGIDKVFEDVWGKIEFPESDDGPFDPKDYMLEL